MRFLICLLILLLPATALPAIYKWVDAEGNVHYSDKKEATTKQTAIKTQPGPREEELSQAQQRYEKLKQSENSNKAKKEEQMKKDAEAQTKLEDKKKRCLKLLDEIEHAKYARSVYYKNGGGERVYVDDATRNKYLDRAQSTYDENCR